jgi:uncharacterized membrane protein YfcA
MKNLRNIAASFTVKKALYPIALIFIICLWFLNTGSLSALYNTYWPEASTMVLGAFVAGSTPLGGGAVAYPVLTKVLAYSTEDARLFSVMIQSVGMTCASLLFIGLGRKIFWKSILFASSVSLIAPIFFLPILNISDSMAKSIFTLFELIALFILLFNLERIKVINQYSTLMILAVFALLGGLLTATIGSGADLMLFIYLVVFKRVTPINAIPSTVIFMSINAFFSLISRTDFNQIDTEIIYAWLAAVPVVAISAPLGAWVIGHLSHKLVLRLIVTLILIDLFSTSFLGSISVDMIIFSNLCLIILFVFRYKNKFIANVKTSKQEKMQVR